MAVDTVIRGGQVVTDQDVRTAAVAIDGEVVGEPGHGRFVARTLPDWDT